MTKDLGRRAREHYLPLVNDHHPVGLDRLIHVMGDEDCRHAFFAIKAENGAHDLRASDGVEHGGGFVEDNEARAHGQDAGNGHSLLLATRQKMRSMGAIVLHVHLPE